MVTLIPMDLYNLVQTCKRYQQKIKMTHIKKSTLDEIDRRLFKIFGTNLDSFKNVLRESDATISGSFIIQCILGERWSWSDIDIYVNTEIFVKFVKSERKTRPVVVNRLSPKKKERKNILKYLKNEYGSHGNFRDDYGDDITDMINFNVNKNKIQIIGIYDKNFKSYMEISFDFNICKNMYAYRNIDIFQINEIFTKCTNFAPRYDLKKNIDRYLKYRERGFNFYLGTKNDLVTNSNILNHLCIDIIHVDPIKKSHRKCKKIMSDVNNNFMCIKNIISFVEDPKKLPRANYKKLLKIQDSELITDVQIYPCSDLFTCLFNYIYPNICHLHAHIYDSPARDVHRYGICVLNDFIS
jgi:predicted MPP superfamily phosphohydrolase